jgi:hypothetical protein
MYILHTQVGNSRYLDYIPYHIWFIEENIVIFTTVTFDNFQFDALMELDLDKKYVFLRRIIERERANKSSLEIDITDDIEISTMDNEPELKLKLKELIREYKINLIIKK